MKCYEAKERNNLNNDSISNTVSAVSSTQDATFLQSENKYPKTKQRKKRNQKTNMSLPVIFSRDWEPDDVDLDPIRN